MKQKKIMVIAAVFFYCLFLILPSFLLHINSVVSNIQTKNSSNIANSNNMITPNFPFSSSSNNPSNDGSSVVNPYKIYKSEPAPMGISDYGINPVTKKSYSYSTTSFLGIAKIYSLNVTGGIIDGYASLQLNAVLKFSVGSSTYVYGLQNVAIVYAACNLVVFEDSLWNLSEPKANVNSSVISGNGWFGEYNSTSYYYYSSGKTSLLVYPDTFQIKITSSLGSNGLPSIAFEYKNRNENWTTYDEVSFFNLSGPIDDMNLVVDGSKYGPIPNTYYEAEFVLTGYGSGLTANVLNGTKLDLQLEYFNGIQYQSIPYAYNFGSDTLEKASNVITKFYNNTSNASNGTSYIELTTGAGNYLGPVIFIPNQTINLWLPLEIIGIVAIGLVIILVVYFSLKQRKRLEKLKKIK